jgi:hypothetical protein
MSTTTTPNPVQATKAVIGLVRFSYANIWEPSAPKGSDKKTYNVSILIDKKDKKTLSAVDKCIKAAIDQGKVSKPGWKGKIPAKLDLPLHDGDIERPDNEEYAGMMYLTPKSSTKPGVVDKDRNPIIEQDQFYSGCYGYVSINFFPYDTMNNGVGCGLNNIMKVKDGEPLGGRQSADEDFKSVDADDDLM